MFTRRAPNSAVAEAGLLESLDLASDPVRVRLKKRESYGDDADGELFVALAERMWAEMFPGYRVGQPVSIDTPFGRAAGIVRAVMGSRVAVDTDSASWIFDTVTGSVCGGDSGILVRLAKELA